MCSLCDTIQSWARWVCCCPATVPVEESKFPPEPLEEYVVYLGDSHFIAGEYSAFSREKTERLAALIYRPSCCTKVSKSLLCCRHIPYGCRVCRSSRDARCAIAAGFCLGCGAAQFGSCLNINSWIVNVISGCVAGGANGSGTWLSMIDSTKRDDRQDIHLALESFFQNLGLYLIQQHMQERKQKMERGDRNPSSTTMTGHALAIEHNRAELRSAVLRYFPTEDEDAEIAILKPLFETVDYITKGTLPNNRILRNEIATIDSPSMEEHLLLTRRVASLKEMVIRLQEDMSRVMVRAGDDRGASKDDE